MPAQPLWFQHLDSILTELRSISSPYIDRQAIEKLFAVRQRRARQLMAGLPSIQIGNAAAVHRESLIERLQNVAGSKSFQWESVRRARVGQAIDQLRRHAAAAGVVIPAAPKEDSSDLGSGVDLCEGVLRIRFTDARDLAAKLFHLSQVMANDWEAFEAAAENSRPF